jgi:CBS domain-containing protein
MVDPVDEELTIMEERQREPSAIPGDVLREPIGTLCTRDAVTVASDAPIRDAIRTMQEHRIGSVIVVDDGRLTGIVTERDVLMKVAGREELTIDQPVSTIMTPDPETLRREDTLVFLMNKMHVGGFRHVPIVDVAGSPDHVLSLRDVLRYLLDHFGVDVVNVPLEPYRGEPKRDSG